MSPDWSSNPISIPFARLDNPQTLNRYSYVGNNPLNRFDPNGHLECGSGGASPTASNGVLSAIGGFFHGVACAVANAFSGRGGSSSDNTSVTTEQHDNFTPEQMGVAPQQQQSQTSSSLFRRPDYYSISAQAGFANPALSFVPQTKNFFFNAQAGAPKGFGVMATAGWSLSRRPEAYLGGRGVGGCAAYVVAGCYGYSPGGGGEAVELGLGTPTIGVTAGYAIDWDSYTQSLYDSIPVNQTGTIPGPNGLTLDDPLNP